MRKMSFVVVVVPAQNATRKPPTDSFIDSRHGGFFILRLVTVSHSG
jgi:hypothetical protein